MKKVVLSLAILMLSGGVVFAQKANVNKAKNKALSTENPDFEGAREAIKLALEDPTTKDQANTWYVAGLIGYKENEKLFLDAQLGQQIDERKKGKAVVESYDYFVKADELGQIPNAKGKISAKPRRDIKPKMLEYFTNQLNLISYGALLFEDDKDYKGAYDVFMRYLNIPKLPMFADPKDQEKVPQDSTYQMIKYFAALSASNAKMSDEAIALFRDLTDDNYETLAVYQLLYQEYYQLKDTANYVEVLKEGHQKFPQEPWFLQNLINHFIFTDQKQEAMVYLDAAIEAEPGIAQYHYVKGNLEEAFGNRDIAIEAFKKAVELDPTLADAYAGMGRVYYNQAVKIQDDAINIKDEAAFEAEQAKANALFEQSVPYFKKAVEAAPDDMDYKRTLRALYYRLGMDAEYDALSKEMGM